jgi:hypothetical protein
MHMTYTAAADTSVIIPHSDGPSIFQGPLNPWSGSTLSETLPQAGRAEAETSTRWCLERVARGEVPPVILVTAKHAETSERTAYGMAAAVDAILIRSTSQAWKSNWGREPEGLVFSCLKDGAPAHFDLRSVIKALRRGPEPVIIEIGDPRNVPFAIEALTSHIPLVPIAVSYTVSADDGAEADFVGKLEELYPVQRVQADASLQSLAESVFTMRDRVLLRSSSLAEEILTPANLRHEHPWIPPAVLRVLEDTLLPKAREHGIQPILTGGIAVAASMQDSRPVSADIDFKTRHSRDKFPELVAFFETLGGEVEIQAHPHKEHSNKSTKISGWTLTGEGHEVDLDLVPVRRCRDNGLVFEFKYDAFLHLYHMEATLPKGSKVAIVPVEVSVMEKLVAGRGAEEGKFDLFDVAGLLANRTVQFPLIQRIIERQRYKKEVDSTVLLEPVTAQNFSRRMQELHIEDPAILNSVAGRIVRDSLDEASSKFLTPDVLKRLSLTSLLLKNLRRIEDGVDSKLPHLPVQMSAADRWGRENVLAGVAALNKFVIFYLENVLGKQDVYVRRTTKSFKRRGETFIEAP